MKFRYYITDLSNGVLTGTDDIEVAEHHYVCEDYYVVDSHTGEWLHADGSRVPVRDVSDKPD